MHRIISIFRIVFLVAGFAACQREVGGETNPPAKPLFDSIPTIATVAPIINEVSGIADSKLNAGHIWAMEDGGNPTQLFLIKHNGAVQKTIYINGITNRDWEDMAMAGNDIYLGEIGDNNAVYPDYAFYKFAEPSSTTDTVRSFQTFRFTYPDGSHDAEAFVVEPSTNNIYIITKRDNPSRIYKLTAPLSATTVNLAQLAGQINYTGVVGAAISPDGKEIILKTYFGLNYYKKENTESIEAALQKAAISIPYQTEPQGEAVCFSTSNNGYFTLSEKGFGSNVQLFFYKRN